MSSTEATKNNCVTRGGWMYATVFLRNILVIIVLRKHVLLRKPHSARDTAQNTLFLPENQF